MILKSEEMKFNYSGSDSKLILNKLSTYNQEYFFKKLENTTYVYYSGESMSFSQQGDFQKGLFLFGMVKKDFDKWISENKNPTFIEQCRPYWANKTLKDSKKKKYSYDINHAYWRIAFISGYISENTYNKGLELKNKNDALKQLYCMALSVRGNSKTLDGYIGTKKTGKKLVIVGNQVHKSIYNDIRNRTYEIMDKIAFKLGDDFVDYNVDCISFVGSENCKLVEKMLTDENVTFKKVIK
jgi:hypothetical protein